MVTDHWVQIAAIMKSQQCEIRMKNADRFACVNSLSRSLASTGSGKLAGRLARLEAVCCVGSIWIISRRQGLRNEIHWTKITIARLFSYSQFSLRYQFALIIEQWRICSFKWKCLVSQARQGCNPVDNQTWDEMRCLVWPCWNFD